MQYSTANIRAIALNRYLVNTEGTVVRQGYTGYDGQPSASADRRPTACVSAATTAPSPPPRRNSKARPAFRKRVIDDLKSLEELRNAPVVSAEDYHGPVLFSGDAAADVIDRLFVPNVEADRPEMGTTARTQGAYSSSFHARVLPDILSVDRRPAQHDLRRHSACSAPTPSTTKAFPRNPSTSSSTASWRTSSSAARPSRTSPTSNGHGRAAAGQAAHSRAGVIIFKSSAAAHAPTS